MKPEQYEEYDSIMKDMESNLSEMHNMVNVLFKAKNQIKDVISGLDASKHNDLIAMGNQLIKDISAWDEDMIQRKSKAYDDVENFPNKFTAEYIFLINQTESSIPRVNDQNKTRKTELDAQWMTLKNVGNSFINNKIPTYNKQLWEAGIGAIKTK